MLFTMTFAVWFLGRVAGPGLLAPPSQAFTCLQVTWMMLWSSGEALVGQGGRVEHLRRHSLLSKPSSDFTATKDPERVGFNLDPKYYVCFFFFFGMNILGYFNISRNFTS